MNNPLQYQDFQISFTNTSDISQIYEFGQVQDIIKEESDETSIVQTPIEIFSIKCSSNILRNFTDLVIMF